MGMGGVMATSDRAHPAAPTSAEQLVTELLTAWNAHDLDRATACFAVDYLGSDVAQAGTQYGPEGMRRMLALYFRALPDLHFTADELVVQGERAVLIWTAHGTHRGALLNIPASGRAVTVRGVSSFTLANGKVSRATHIWDVAGLLRAIGLLPEL